MDKVLKNIDQCYRLHNKLKGVLHEPNKPLVLSTLKLAPSVTTNKLRMLVIIFKNATELAGRMI